jgi:glycosyltransferase involved in cell wall biosynthesis
VFFQNAQDRDLFLTHKLVSPAKSSVLAAGSGIDLLHFQPVTRPAKTSDQPHQFLLIARLLADKGIREYVQAARQIKQQHPQCRFVLAGALGVQNQTAIDAQELAQWQAEGVIDYAGEVADVRPLIAASDCVVLPSYREGMPRVLIEAMAIATPVIATRVAGCEDCVQHGINGLLCEVRSVNALADAMLGFLQMPAQAKQQLGENGRRIAEDRFDEQRVHEAYLAQTKSALAQA